MARKREAIDGSYGIFLLPGIVLFVCLVFLPFVANIVLSFTRWSGVGVPESRNVNRQAVVGQNLLGGLKVDFGLLQLGFSFAEFGDGDNLFIGERPQAIDGGMLQPALRDRTQQF